jgi:hypothetical protein
MGEWRPRERSNEGSKQMRLRATHYVVARDPGLQGFRASGFKMQGLGLGFRSLGSRIQVFRL